MCTRFTLLPGRVYFLCALLQLGLTFSSRAAKKVIQTSSRVSQKTMTAVTTSAPPPAPHKHRVMRGARYSTEAPATLPPLFSLDSAFQLQEYIAQLVKFNPHDVDAIVSLPPNATSNEGSGGDVDLNCWIYEQIRRLAQDLTSPLITHLQHECDRNSCPEMKAGEWLYLCVAHGNGGTMEVSLIFHCHFEICGG